LIHGTPEILLLAVDSNEDFVQVPNIAEAALTPLQFSSIVRTELLTPDSDRFIRDDDSAFGEKILDISEAQAETMVNPDGIADDFPRNDDRNSETGRSSWDQCSSSLPKLAMPARGNLSRAASIAAAIPRRVLYLTIGLAIRHSR
jgi:hypothetical protein